MMPHASLPADIRDGNLIAPPALRRRAPCPHHPQLAAVLLAVPQPRPRLHPHLPLPRRRRPHAHALLQLQPLLLIPHAPQPRLAPGPPRAPRAENPTAQPPPRIRALPPLMLPRPPPVPGRARQARHGRRALAAAAAGGHVQADGAQDEGQDGRQARQARADDADVDLDGGPQRGQRVALARVAAADGAVEAVERPEADDGDDAAAFFLLHRVSVV